MAKIHDLFIEIGHFKKYLPKATKARKNRQYYYAQAESSLLKIGSLLDDAEVVTLLNELLQIVQQEINGPRALESAQGIVKAQQAAFLRAENSLHYLTGLKTADYEEVVNLIGQLLPTTDIRTFPRSAKELRDHFQATANKFIQTSKESSVLPRKQKDQAKAAILSQHWRYVVGTMMTLGNVAGFLLPTLHLGLGPQIASGAFGVASCRYGVALFKVSEGTRETRRKPPASEKLPTNNTEAQL